MTVHRLQALLVLTVACLFTYPAAAQQTLPAEQLQRFLQRFPAADANGDGELTNDEAREFRSQQTQQRQPQRAGSLQPTEANVAYGPHERNVFDFYRAASDKPTPLIIYIHGGGFVGGDKKSIDKKVLESALDHGISCAALHYRFVDGNNVVFPAPQHDCARAVQYLRAHADQYNIDAKKFACFGGSAGAGISMWLGFHDDLAEPDSQDPVARQSTRIVAIGTFGGQGTYDPIKIKQLIGGRAWEHPSLRLVYGLKTAADGLQPTPAMQALYDEASAITHLTKDDPALLMVYSEADEPLPDNARPGQGIHHPNFGKQLKQAMDALEIENIYLHTSNVNRNAANMQMFEFFQKKFE